MAKRLWVRKREREYTIFNQEYTLRSKEYTLKTKEYTIVYARVHSSVDKSIL